MYMWILLLLRRKVPRYDPLDVHGVGYRRPTEVTDRSAVNVGHDV